MSLLDNIKGRSGDEGEPGGKFNPFRLLEIGEIMVRYTDGIRIKDFVFLAVLTSERLILIDSARQGTGQITKEIPFSVIKRADLERDERDRPALAISMEVGDQQRIMRLVFTGLINEPDSECREWYTAINGYPPERIDSPVPHLDEPAQAPAAESGSVPSAPAPVVEVPPVYQAPPEPVPQTAHVSLPTAPQSPPSGTPIRAEPVQGIQQPVPQLQPEPMQRDHIPPAHEPVSQPVPPAPVRQPTVQAAARVTVAPVPPRTPSPPPTRENLSHIPLSEGSLRIVIEKPDLSPIRVRTKASGDGGTSTKSFMYCIHCGARTPSQARFCHVCGNSQN